MAPQQTPKTETQKSIYNEYQELRRIIRSNSGQVRDRKTQEDISYLIREIECYGFDFFPEHYVRRSVNELRSYVDKYYRNRRPTRRNRPKKSA